MSTTTILAVVAIKMRRYKNAFRTAGAVTPRTAIRPADAGLRQSMIFKKLVRQQVLLPVGDGRYYLDETRDLVVMRQRRIVLYIIVMVLVLVLAATYLLRNQF